MDGRGLQLIAGLSLLLMGLGVWEAIGHGRTVASFRIRVHVNGTRGKSSVTRLIAAGLRAGGLKTAAKTTGTLPRLIHPDGREEPILRRGRTNVIEQVAVLHRAARLGAEAVVIECMALQPFLQWISTARLVRPTHGIITNIRADHLDVMGPTTRGVALALAGSVPVAGKLYLGDTRYRQLFNRVCADRRTELIIVRPEHADAPVSAEELAAFAYVEHAENVELALRICVDLGVERQLALRGMQLAHPDPGALTIERIQLGRESFTVVNGFAANDPESTERIWELAVLRAGLGRTKIALINCRADRAERSQQLGAVVVRWTAADYYVVTGTGTHFFVVAAAQTGLDPSRVVVAEGEQAAVLAQRLAHLSGGAGLVVGLGNIGGVGLQLLDHLRALRSQPPVSRAPRHPSRLPELPGPTASAAPQASEENVAPPPKFARHSHD